MSNDSTAADSSDQTHSGEPPSYASDPLRRSGTSRFWVATIGFAVILVLLIIFIAQNTQGVRVRFLGWDGETPLAVALLIAAAAAILVTAVAGSLRILQLRRRVHREKRHGRRRSA